MKVIVVGAGVVGVSTAWCLARDGHHVEVVEAHGIADAASAVNAGLIVPGDSIVWAAPGVPRELAKTLLGRTQAGVVVRPLAAGPGLLGWGLRFLKECRLGRNPANVAAAHCLSRYSYAQLQELTAELGLDYAHQRNGMVLLFASERARAEGLDARRNLAALGEQYREFTPDDLVALDPGYRRAGARYPYPLYTPGSGHGDCRRFVLALAEHARRLGVSFHPDRAVTRLPTAHGRVTAAETSAGPLRGDLYVLAAGSASARLARRAGVHLPIQPARGYAVTVRIADDTGVPWIGGVAEDAHVAYSRTATHVRISSTAEFSGHDSPPAHDAYAGIGATGRELFGDALDWSDVAYLSGQRPMTPRGLPLIGPTGVSNLFVNTGHGHLGWTQACGSARLLADLVAQRAPGVPPEPYRLRSPRSQR